MSGIRVEINGVLREWWDDSVRRYKTFTAAGTAILPDRAYTAEENLAADRRIADETALVNALDGTNKMSTVDIPAMQTIIADTNANINSNAAARIKDLAVAVRRLDKRMLNQFDTP